MRLVSAETAEMLEKAGVSIQRIGVVQTPEAIQLLDHFVGGYADVPQEVREAIILLQASSPAILSPTTVFSRNWGSHSFGQKYEARIFYKDNKWSIMVGSKIPTKLPAYIINRHPKLVLIRDSILASEDVAIDESKSYYVVQKDIMVGTRQYACAIAIGNIDSGREWHNDKGEDIPTWRKK